MKRYLIGFGLFLVVAVFFASLRAEDLSTATTPYNADVINGTPTQRVKVCWGTDNTVTDASASNPLPVTGTFSSSVPTSGGYTYHHVVSANSNNATSLKASAGQVYSIQVFNLNASPRYLKFYNKASAPSPGSDTVVKSILIPGNTAGAGVALSWPGGVEFSTGIAYALVTGVGNTDNTAVAASEIVLNIDYK